jgi:hypothetical protein
MYRTIDDEAEPSLLIRRSYFDRNPEEFKWGGVDFTAYAHPFGELYMGLNRASYRVDLILEPEPMAGTPRSQLWRDAMGFLPRTLIVRARKEGN